MKSAPLHRVVHGAVVTLASAIPVVTTAEILLHAQGAPAAPTVASAPAQPSTGHTAPSSGPSATQGAPAASAGPQTYTGPAVSDPFGDVQATITVTAGKITSVSISAPQDNPQSAYINGQAVPILQSETLQAQSAQIDGVSGATLTSEAYAQSLQAALQQAHLG